MSVTHSSLQRIVTDALVGCNLVAICAIRDETIIYMNERCATLLGRSGNEGDVAVPMQDVVAAADWPPVARWLRQAANRPGISTAITCSAVRSDGSIADLELAVSAAAGGEHAVLVSVVTDISHKVFADTQLSYLAFNDPLTRLPNRALFFDRLRQTLIASRRSGQAFALLACDLDDFKAVNDTHGHDAGDAVLQAAAARLRSCCREEDTAARIGGDEFMLILPGDVAPSGAAQMANRVMAALAEPIPIGWLSCSVDVSISIGIACYPQNGQSIEMLFRSADAAMYASKSAGKGRLTFADPGRPDPGGSPMSFIALRDIPETGIRVIDAQHRTLAVMIENLGTDLASGEDLGRVRDAFDALIAFAQSHFAIEESLMDRYAIDDRVSHKQMHRKLLQEARSLATSLELSSMMLVMGSLHDWLLHHVDFADRALVRQLEGKGYVDTQP